jgi:hypothetical protein
MTPDKLMGAALVFAITALIACAPKAVPFPEAAKPGPFGAPADAKSDKRPAQIVSLPPGRLLNPCRSDTCRLECAEGNPSKPRYCMSMIPPTPAESQQAFDRCVQQGRCADPVPPGQSRLEPERE